MPKDLIVSFGAQRGQEFGCCSNHSFGCLVHFGCSNHQEREILIFCKYTWFKSQSPSRFHLCSFLVRGWLIIMGKPLNKIDLKLHMIISSFSWPKMPIRLGPILYPWTTSVVQLPPPAQFPSSLPLLFLSLRWRPVLPFLLNFAESQRWRITIGQGLRRKNHLDVNWHSRF